MAIGIVVQIPFMNTPLYVGPISEHINGADLSWLVGLLITSPLYYWLANRDTADKRRLATGKTGHSRSNPTLQLHVEAGLPANAEGQAKLNDLTDHHREQPRLCLTHKTQKLMNPAHHHST